jgi:hypothetical protein
MAAAVRRAEAAQASEVVQIFDEDNLEKHQAH